MVLGRLPPLSELDRDIVLHLVGDHLQPKARWDSPEGDRNLLKQNSICVRPFVGTVEIEIIRIES